MRNRERRRGTRAWNRDGKIFFAVGMREKENGKRHEEKSGKDGQEWKRRDAEHDRPRRRERCIKYDRERNEGRRRRHEEDRRWWNRRNSVVKEGTGRVDDIRASPSGSSDALALS